jgi:hypothetical protein
VAPLHDRRNNCGHERAHEHGSLNAKMRNDKQKPALGLIKVGLQLSEWHVTKRQFLGVAGATR